VRQLVQPCGLRVRTPQGSGLEDHLICADDGDDTIYPRTGRWAADRIPRTAARRILMYPAVTSACRGEVATGCHAPPRDAPSLSCDHL
jgi:hypothetical protein